MNRTMPPFPAMRAFESAARHLSFKAAAEELNVTQSAISHQIKALEDFLKLPLFVRRTRGVSLTPAGRAYLPELCAAMDALSQATERALAENLSGTLTISATSAFATKWLMPRICWFRDAYPDLEVFVNADPSTTALADLQFDVAIRFGNGNWPGHHAERMMRSMLFPVCSPELRDGVPPLRDPSDLRHHTLLHYDHGVDWGRWLARASASDVDPSSGIHFNNCGLMFEAASLGQGVALGYGALLASDLAAGHLVRPFDVDLVPADWYHFICAKPARNQPKIRAFHRWISRETAKDDVLEEDLNSGTVEVAAAGGQR